MIPEAILLIFCSLLTIPLIWTLRKNAGEVLAIWTLAILAVISPASAVWLVGSSLFISMLMFAGDQWGYRNHLTLFGASLLTALLLYLREIPQILWIGGAYFTLRNLHVLFDWWMGRLMNPGVIRNLRYQLFLPTLMAGPINRLQVFERQLDRHRWDSGDFFSGMERLLFGIAQVVVFGSWFISQLENRLLVNTHQAKAFFSDWTQSILNWSELYFLFSGYSSIALGLALMMGLRLEENFNRPWAAKNLIDFWLRWHITLSQWVRNYVFQPVTALTRSPVIGLTAAMLVIGLWHETSAYYVLWALWQALGIILTRVIQSIIHEKPAVQKIASKLAILSPIYVLGWLSLAHPLVTRFLEFLL